MRKLLLSVLLLSLLFFYGCNKKVTVINEVTNHVVDVDDLMTISTLDEVLNVTSTTCSNYIVGILSSNIDSLLQKEANGSGVLIHKELINNDTYKYYVLTNRHVVTYNNSYVYSLIRIYLGNNIFVEANVESYDNSVDVALVSFTTKIELLTAPLSHDSLKLGSFVLSIGCPFDTIKYFRTVNIGNISSVSRIIEETNIHKEVVHNTYFQHNAHINVGDSGGGIFNLKGELIGINNWKIGSRGELIEGIGFGISLEEIRIVLDIDFGLTKK